MHTHGIQVFHVADSDCGIIRITHYFVFNFLITLDTLFYQNLMHRR